MAALACSFGAVGRPAPIAAASLSIDAISVTCRAGETVGFISEDLIAVGCHSGPFGGGAGTVSTVQWKNGELRVLALRTISRYAGGAGVGGRRWSSAVPGVEL